MDMPVGEGTLGELLVVLIVLGVMIGFVVFCIYMAVMTGKAKEQKKKRKKELAAAGVLNTVEGRHMAGLPLSPSALCDIYEYEDKVIFKSNASEFNLAKGKITDVALKTDQEIRSQYVSSIGGAVAGAALFGPLGAIVGGRVKKKEDKTIYRYLIFTYIKEDTVDYISFDVTWDFSAAQKLCFNFAQNKVTNKISIDL